MHISQHNSINLTYRHSLSELLHTLMSPILCFLHVRITLSSCASSLHSMLASSSLVYYILVALTYSIVCFIAFAFPNNLSIFIFPIPTFLLNICTSLLSVISTFKHKVLHHLNSISTFTIRAIYFSNMVEVFIKSAISCIVVSA